LKEAKGDFMNPSYHPSQSNQPQKGSYKGLMIGCLGTIFLIFLLIAGGFGYFIWEDRSARHPDYYGKIVTPKEQIVRYGLNYESINPNDNQLQPLKTLDPQSTDARTNCFSFV
jgi:hypothetical protein